MYAYNPKIFLFGRGEGDGARAGSEAEVVHDCSFVNSRREKLDGRCLARDCKEHGSIVRGVIFTIVLRIHRHSPTPPFLT